MDRLTELEIKVSWLEKLVSDLDGVLREAIARIDRQQAEIVPFLGLKDRQHRR